MGCCVVLWRSDDILTLNQDVAGSIPARPTNNFNDLEDIGSDIYWLGYRMGYQIWNFALVCLENQFSIILENSAQVETGSDISITCKLVEIQTADAILQHSGHRLNGSDTWDCTTTCDRRVAVKLLPRQEALNELVCAELAAALQLHYADPYLVDVSKISRAIRNTLGSMNLQDLQFLVASDWVVLPLLGNLSQSKNYDEVKNTSSLPDFWEVTLFDLLVFNRDRQATNILFDSNNSAFTIFDHNQTFGSPTQSISDNQVTEGLPVPGQFHQLSYPHTPQVKLDSLLCVIDLWLKRSKVAPKIRLNCALNHKFVTPTEIQEYQKVIDARWCNLSTLAQNFSATI